MLLKTQRGTRFNLMTKDVILLCCLILLITLSFFNISYYLFPKKNSGNNQLVHSNTNQTVVYWQEFLESHPTYFFGWIELAELELMSGNKSKAIEALMQANNINPNSQEVKTISEDVGFKVE